MSWLGRVFCVDVENATDCCYICGQVLNPDYGKPREYWLEYDIVEPWQIDGRHLLCDPYANHGGGFDCVTEYVRRFPVPPAAGGQMDLFMEVAE